MVELKLPLGLVLDEDKDGNVFVKSIDKGSRAEKSGLVFERDIVGSRHFTITSLKTTASIQLNCASSPRATPVAATCVS